jgi:hypothetical protein
VLLHLVETRRVYPPDAVAAMTVAFDTVRQSLSARVSGSDDVRRQLALIILRHTADRIRPGATFRACPP